MEADVISGCRSVVLLRLTECPPSPLVPVQLLSLDVCCEFVIEILHCFFLANLTNS